ncbi:MAG TPA: glycoside hydrolase family 15 protein [Bacteriovoracaceae bacterium]|nr:glycoside hydrolase family 15 protein [Bacteriovoracaceae bacterium]
MKKSHRYNLAITGNCHYLAYVNDDSSVDWMCWPYMDSSFIFGSILDKDKGGTFKVIPQSPFKTKQKYIENTAVIVTTFFCEDGDFEVIDFAPRFHIHDRSHKPLQFMRKIKRIKGQPRITVICDPRGDYGELVPEVSVGSNHISYKNLHYPLRLTTNAAKSYLIEKRDFTLTEDIYMVLSGGDPFEASLKETFEEFFYKTIRYWRSWVKDTYIPNLFQKEIIRSAITIKLHQFEDTGAIIASGTTSLPEYPGSGRNWDYRYCWLRDSYFSLAALNSLGHFEEAEKYLHFIHNILYDISHLQPVYKINGEAEMPEREVPLAGYMGSGPVRVGNAAYYQKQYDSYGQVILSLLPLYMDERIIHREQMLSLDTITSLLNEIEKRMDEPDAGIWEFRGKRQKHLETYIFHWAGAKAGIKIARHYQDTDLEDLATRVLELATLNIEKCWDPKVECYMSDQTLAYYDASAYLLILLNYLSPQDPKTLKHFKRLEKELLSPEGMMYRYKAPDDFGDTHATFLICTYWYIEALVCLGYLDDAEKTLQNIIIHANHVGLLSEDLSSEDGGQWGNFPQTYSHVGLINSVCRLARKRDKQIFE